jgi:CubicO group peptidase (beta-lactamase class C family)
MNQSARSPRLRALGYVVSACLAFAGGACAEESTPQQAVSDLMLLAGIPGMQVAVVKGDKVAWQHSFGEAVLDSPGPKTPMRDDTRLVNASVGKIFTTVAVMQLVDAGRIKLDDDIDRYVPWVIRNPNWPRVPISWRMLLSHTSSLNEEDDEHASATLVLGKDDPERTLASVTEAEFAPNGRLQFEGRWTKSKPGTARIYSSDAFTLMAYAVERLIGKPFGEYLDQAVFAPLGLTHTFYRLKGHEAEPFAVPYASIRQAGGRHQFEPAKKFWFHEDPGGSVLSHQLTGPDFPSGIYHTTAADLTRLMRMLLNGGTVDGVRVLSSDSVKTMMTPNGLYNHEGWRQGVGLYGPRDLNGRWVWGHDGVDRGVAAAFFLDPKSQVGAIAIGNAQYPDWTLTAALVDIDLHLIDWFE